MSVAPSFEPHSRRSLTKGLSRSKKSGRLCRLSFDCRGAADFATRRLIEPGILREATRHLGKRQIKELRALLAEEERLTSERGQSARRAEIKASGDFHLALAAITGNAILQRFMDELIARSSLVIALYGQSVVSSCGHAEHQQIIDALESGDIEAACRLMLDHINHIEADLDLQAKQSGDLKDVLRL